MKDNRAIQRAGEGSEDTFRRLYDDHRERVFRIAYRYTRSIEDAEDVMQETFVKAFKRIETFGSRKESGFSNWISSICINCAIDHLRKRKRRKAKSAVPVEDVTANLVANEDSPESAAEKKEIFRLITTAAERLTPMQRVVFDLRYNKQHSIKEIAAIMDCNENTVKTQLSRSIQKLKRTLAPIWRER